MNATPNGPSTDERYAEAAQEADHKRRAIRAQQNGWSAREVVLTFTALTFALPLLFGIGKNLAEDASDVCWSCFKYSIGIQVDKLTGQRADVPETAPDGTPMA